MNSIDYSQNPTDGHIDNVLHGLRPPIAIKGRPAIRWTLAERMEAYHVPGVSMAIIERGQVIWAGGFGVKEAETTDPVTPSTLFQAASISKPVATTAMLRLVDTGKLSLDEDVNNYLRHWKVPENSFTIQEKVTLRRILSHSAGLTVHGFAGYSSSELIPTLQQILDGEKPANSLAIRVDTLPGSLFRYSGGGFTVMQQLLVDITDEPFPLSMKRLVLEPAGMTRSTYEQPLPDYRRKEAASGYDGGGKIVRGNWHNYPEMAAAGLWTTPVELAKWAVEISNAWCGRTNKLLSKTIAAQMLTMQKSPWGLGVRLEGTDKVIGFCHAGANEGFQAEFVTFPGEGRGAVMMTNANQGILLIGEVFQSIAAEFHWPGRIQIEREVVPLTTDQLDGLVGKYSAPMPQGMPFSYEVSRAGDQLFGEPKGSSQKSALYAANTDTFFSLDGFTMVFTRDKLGRAAKINIGNLEAIREQ